MKIMCFASGIIVALLFVYGPAQWYADSRTTQSLSPDERYRVYLVERSPNAPVRIDRNFDVYLVGLEGRGHSETKWEKLFYSPDEGRPIGSERFIWSRDSEYLLLVGRHFFVADDIPTVAGEQAYFLYHIPSKRKWFNSKQAAGKGATLTLEQLRTVNFEQATFADGAMHNK